MSLCCETKINAPLIYEEQDKDMMKSEILPHSSVTEQGFAPKRQLGGSSFNAFFTSWRHLSRGILRGNSKEEPFMVLMFLCQHGRIYA